MADRVRRPKKYEDFMAELKDSGAFETLKDILVFAACLGLRRNQRASFKEAAESINLQTFGAEFDKMVFNTIAIKETGDPFVMANNRSDESVLIFEEYACGGLEVMSNEISGAHTDKEEVLIGLVMAEQTQGKILDEITGLGGF